MPLSGGDVHVPHPIWRGGDPHYSAIPIIITVPDCSIGVVHRDVRLLYVHILWASSRPSPLFLAGVGGGRTARALCVGLRGVLSTALPTAPAPTAPRLVTLPPSPNANTQKQSTRFLQRWCLDNMQSVSDMMDGGAT